MSIDTILTNNEARVIGCLIEKEIATPDQYPLSLNALTSACNQKTSRDPIMQLDENSVQAIIDGLVKKRLVSEKSGYGGRVPKYQHLFCNTEFGKLKFSAQELGIICVLLLRGQQSAGELRTRTNRLCHFADVQETDKVLQQLIDRDDGPFIVRLPRESGRRDVRYAHLFCGEVKQIKSSQPVPEVSAGSERVGDRQQRIEQLEVQLKGMREELNLLKARVDDLEQGH